MQRNTHRYTHIHTKQDQLAQHLNKTKIFLPLLRKLNITVAAPVNQSGRFRCSNRKLVVWKANCLTDCDLVRTGAHNSRCSRTSGRPSRLSALRIVLILLKLLTKYYLILHCFWHAPKDVTYINFFWY